MHATQESKTIHISQYYETFDLFRGTNVCFAKLLLQTIDNA